MSGKTQVLDCTRSTVSYFLQNLSTDNNCCLSRATLEYDITASKAVVVEFCNQMTAGFYVQGLI